MPVGQSPRGGASSPAPSLRRLSLAIGALLGLTLIGTTGYVALENLPVLDALYLTVTTLSTVGYGDVVPLHTAGRIFTLCLIVIGVGAVLYLLTVVGDLVWDGRLRELLGRRAMDHQIDRMHDHVIVCGYGRLGRVVVGELRRSATPVVVVDVDPALGDELTDAGIPHITASALSDSVLEHAGIRRARAVAVATGSDADNVFIALTARELHPGIRIHARAESDAGLRHLKLAGADSVLSAYQAGGARLAASILRPALVDVLEIDGTDHAFDVGEIRVESASPVLGQRVRNVEAALGDLRVVALQPATGELSLKPHPDAILHEGDRVIVVGTRESIGALATNAQHPVPPSL